MELVKDCMKLGFGLMRLPQLADKTTDVEQTKQMVDAFIAAGGKYFDTAYIYAGSEPAAKEALCSRYPRESYYLADKLNAAAFACSSEEEAKNEIKVSLERTGAGYFDFYLLHGIDAENIKRYDSYGIWDYMHQLKSEGLIKHIGFSFHDEPALLEKILTDHPDMEFVQLQINYADMDSCIIASRECYDIASPWRTDYRDGTREGRHPRQSSTGSERLVPSHQPRGFDGFVGNPICGFSAECDGRAQWHVEYAADERQSFLHERVQTSR